MAHEFRVNSHRAFDDLEPGDYIAVTCFDPGIMNADGETIEYSKSWQLTRDRTGPADDPKKYKESDGDMRMRWHLMILEYASETCFALDTAVITKKADRTVQDITATFLP